MRSARWVVNLYRGKIHMSRNSSGKLKRQRLKNPDSKWAQINSDNKFVRVGLFILFATSLISLLIFGNTEPTPVINLDDIGLTAEYDIYATRHFTYTLEDPHTTVKNREEAAASVPRVYNWNSSLGKQIIYDFSSAMRYMRSQLSEAEKEFLSKVVHQEFTPHSNTKHLDPLNKTEKPLPKQMQDMISAEIEKNIKDIKVKF